METNQIPFKVGDKIAIVSKMRGNRGWWKGKIGGKVCQIAYLLCKKSCSVDNDHVGYQLT
jgi:hypothetical protein